MACFQTLLLKANNFLFQFHGKFIFICFQCMLSVCDTFALKVTCMGCGDIPLILVKIFTPH